MVNDLFGWKETRSKEMDKDNEVGEELTVAWESFWSGMRDFRKCSQQRGSAYAPWWSKGRASTLEGLAKGKNPFERANSLHNSTAFHDAARNKDLELMLKMVADPDSLWEKRFLFCCNNEMDVPLRGRECIRRESNFFLSEATWQSIEVMLMYGYKMSSRDLEEICKQVRQDPAVLPVAVFTLAFVLKPPSQTHRFNLGECLCHATGHNPESSTPGVFPESSRELAKILLCAGANPNYRFSTPMELDDCIPVLYQAIRNDDSEMVKLLMEYGADPAKAKTHLDFDENESPFMKEYPIFSLAKEKGMLELLISPKTPIVVDSDDYINSLRHDIAKPLRVVLSGIISVAITRATGQVPPVGAVSATILSFCNFLYD